MGTRIEVAAKPAIGVPLKMSPFNLSARTVRDLHVGNLIERSWRYQHGTILNFADTQRGAALLKETVFNPLRDREGILKIQDAVACLAARPKMSDEIRPLIRQIGETRLVTPSRSGYDYERETPQGYLVKLRHLLGAAKNIGQKLETNDSGILRGIKEQLDFSREDNPLGKLLKILSSPQVVIEYSFLDGKAAVTFSGSGSPGFIKREKQRIDLELEEDILMVIADKTRKFELGLIYQIKDQLDLYLSLAEAARRWNWSKPEIAEDGGIEIVNGWHPIVQALNEKNGSPAIRHTTRVTPEQNLLAVSGPNAGGKSTYLRELGLISLLAQIGSFVPAEAARLTLFDGIFTHFPAGDDIYARESTFQRELREFGETLQQATCRSLMLCDEVILGTDPGEGEDLFCGILTELPQRTGIAVVSTHHRTALQRLEGRIPALQNIQATGVFKDGKFIPAYMIQPGISTLTYAIDFAEATGLPAEMIASARKLRGEK